VPRLTSAACCLLVLPVLAFATGCGSDKKSDSDQISDIVVAVGKDPSAVCDHASKALISYFKTKAGCVTASKAGKTDPSTKVKSVKVTGDKAVASITSKTGAQQITFIKEDGKWVIQGSGQ
jgi:hypothetical protein